MTPQGVLFTQLLNEVKGTILITEQSKLPFNLTLHSILNSEWNGEFDIS